MTRRWAGLLACLIVSMCAGQLQPVSAQSGDERQDIMMAMEKTAKKPASLTSARDKAALAARRLARAGQQLLLFETIAVTNEHVLPWSELPERIDAVMSIRACRGEYEPASFVAFPIHSDLTIEVIATDLKGGDEIIPADRVDIRAVKCWYQAGAGEGYSQPPKYIDEVGERDIMILENTPVYEGRYVLTPELLLKDDDLVRTDKWFRQNFVKLQYPDGIVRWLWISAPRVVFPDGNTVEPWIMSPDTIGSQKDPNVDDVPIFDAKTLQPVTIPQYTSKQFWITVHVPDDANAGVYTGKIEVRSQGELLDTVTLELEVLPFDLAPNHLESSMYFHFFQSTGFVGMKLDESGGGSVGADIRSVEQYRAELEDLLAHGVDNPTEATPLEQLETALQIRKEVGLSNRILYHTYEGLGGWELRKVDVERLKKIVELAKKYGYEEVFFYGLDEAQGERLRASYPELMKFREAGGKMFSAGLTPELGGDNFDIVGDLQDLIVMSYTPRKEFADMWHSKGHKIMSYANPQGGFEKPETYRRNYGLVLDRANYDGGMTFAYNWVGWNDFNVWPPYRDHNFAYPTVDGVIDTIQWEGYREGIDDLRYLNSLRQAMAKAEDAGASATLKAARNFMDALDVSNADLHVVRNEMIGLILELNKAIASADAAAAR